MMMGKRYIRNQVADWLQMVINKVGEITEGGNPSKFNMCGYITGWDKDHKCGTCCCVQGWMPVILPEHIEWYGSRNIRMIKTQHRGFIPEELGLPFNRYLWHTLTISGPTVNGTTSGNGYLYFTYDKVKEFWEETISKIRSGELDHYLIFK